jgi:hypothetical protein
LVITDQRFNLNLNIPLAFNRTLLISFTVFQAMAQHCPGTRLGMLGWREKWKLVVRSISHP